MTMTIINPAFQFQSFTELQQEAHAAIRSGNLEGARIALAEIENIWLHSDWPRLRAAAASFLRRYSEFAEYSRFAV